jgi:hypothetical protein
VAHVLLEILLVWTVGIPVLAIGGATMLAWRRQRLVRSGRARFAGSSGRIILLDGRSERVAALTWRSGRLTRLHRRSARVIPLDRAAVPRGRPDGGSRRRGSGHLGFPAA